MTVRGRNAESLVRDSSQGQPNCFPTATVMCALEKAVSRQIRGRSEAEGWKDGGTGEVPAVVEVISTG